MGRFKRQIDVDVEHTQCETNCAQKDKIHNSESVKKENLNLSHHNDSNMREWLSNVNK